MATKPPTSHLGCGSDSVILPPIGPWLPNDVPLKPQPSGDCGDLKGSHNVQCHAAVPQPVQLNLLGFPKIVGTPHDHPF